MSLKHLANSQPKIISFRPVLLSLAVTRRSERSFYRGNRLSGEKELLQDIVLGRKAQEVEFV